MTGFKPAGSKPRLLRIRITTYEIIDLTIAADEQPEATANSTHAARHAEGSRADGVESNTNAIASVDSNPNDNWRTPSTSTLLPTRRKIPTPIPNPESPQTSPILMPILHHHHQRQQAHKPQPRPKPPTRSHRCKTEIAESE
ncbi:hypothetical protein BJ165DRAFT_642456 [Panaeolus papilionaceus]|nr:hypothetical protein BJ165DRAFT_642456 [Panaeolus papilionaceus]